MNPQRYQQIRKEALKRIAARNGQQPPSAQQPVVREADDDAQLISFETPEALMEALQKGE